jgi:hypothetical protein
MVLDSDPICYFNRWLNEPIMLQTEFSVLNVIESLNHHAMAQDETASDYIMPTGRCREAPGKFRILGENQDGWYCFVYEGEEARANPPVYFDSCLDLKIAYGFSDTEIINNDHVLVCSQFTSFLWLILGRQICLRMEGSGLYRSSVSGIVFSQNVQANDYFVDPLERQFPAGQSPMFSECVIYIPYWGAAFLNEESRDNFLEQYCPTITNDWSCASTQPIKQ